VILVDFAKFVTLVFVLWAAFITLVYEFTGHDKGSVAHYWAPYLLVSLIIAGVGIWAIVHIERVPRPTVWAGMVLGFAQFAVWLVTAGAVFMCVVLLPTVAAGGGVPR
jgi:hypothetical protein